MLHLTRLVFTIPVLLLASCGAESEETSSNESPSMMGDTPAPNDPVDPDEGGGSGDDDGTAGSAEPEAAGGDDDVGEPSVDVPVIDVPGSTPSGPDPSSPAPGATEPEPVVTGEPEAMPSEPEPVGGAEPEPMVGEPEATTEPEVGPAGPCDGKACGDPCDPLAGADALVAAPGFPGVEDPLPPMTATCNAEGACSYDTPVCGVDPGDCSATCPVNAICQLCDDGQTCATAHVACAPDGGCGETTWVCPMETEPEPGGQCPDSCPVTDLCMLCEDGTCAAGTPTCNDDGSCGSTEWTCPEDKPEPNAGECPDMCSVITICQVCADESCAEAVVSCNPDGSCGDVEWVCPDGSSMTR